jgi:hypothetical protein
MRCGALTLKLVHARSERGDLPDQFLCTFRIPHAALFHHNCVDETTDGYEECKNVHAAPAFFSVGGIE